MVCEKPVEQAKVMDPGLILAKSEEKPMVASENEIISDSTYGTEARPCHSSGLNHLGDSLAASNSASGNDKSNPNPPTKVRSNGIKPSKLYANLSKISAIALNPRSHPSVATTNVTQAKFDTQQRKSSNKSGSYNPSGGYANVYKPSGNHQSLSFQKRGVFGHVNRTPVGYRSNLRTLDWNDKTRSNRKNELEMSSELTRGHRVKNTTETKSTGLAFHKRDECQSNPRTLDWNDKMRSNRKNEPELSSELTRGPRVKNTTETKSKGLAFRKRDEYNLAEFQTEYETAKFYIIKSYSEDDVHKCLKYDVWSSTTNGNVKLNDAYQDAEEKAYETGMNCPVFLFFSVNGSGQFLGVAEMTGKVDYKKTMDFWQQNKWSGFFPVKWHIVKDVPNSQLRHILLENNYNRPVTFTRDTQEVGLRQGIEMLKIFKNYLSRTSLLDDLEFYESREKALLMRSRQNQ